MIKEHQKNVFQFLCNTKPLCWSTDPFLYIKHHHRRFYFYHIKEYHILEGFSSELGTALSNCDSVILVIITLVLLAMHFISYFLKSKLLTYLCRKCKLFLLSDSQMVEFLSGDFWIGSGFRLTSTNSNKRNI